MEYPPLNPPRKHRLTGMAADALLSAKVGANRYEVKDWVPLLGGTGLGDLFMGQAPELVDDASYQGLKALYKGGNFASGGIGTFRPDKRILDAAFLGADAFGIGKGLGSLGRHLAKKGGEKLTSAAHNASRRDFLKRSAALGGTAALGAVGLGALRKVGKESGEAVAEVVPKYKFNSLKEYNDYLDEISEDQARIARSESGLDLDYPNLEDYSHFGQPYDPSAWKRRFAREDEAAYNTAKEAAKNPNKLPPPPMEVNPYTGRTVEYKDAFSPKAKYEMKEYKKAYSNNADKYRPDSKGDWADDLGYYVNTGGDIIPF